MKTILLIHGPNLNRLGDREPEIYGRTTLPEIETMMTARGRECRLAVRTFQSNHEGAIIDFIQGEQAAASGIIINPGALAHYAYALRDCLTAVACPVIEVHISNVHKREAWRRTSILAEVCTGVIGGLGVDGYLLALEYFREK
ncbi:MAG: type II 3-dehydroquinate dehydratase [candidate division Zixibacteria bacterium]|nr:type II 3-dehydroquinate dehydratase [candidate division Zixibacteria bacterium]